MISGISAEQKKEISQNKKFTSEKIDMEELENLDETAYLLSEELRFEAGTAEQALEYMQDKEEGQPSYHHLRGSAREKLEEAEKTYLNAVAVLKIAEEFEAGEPDEQRNEEVRLEKEKYMHTEEPEYTGKVGEAMAEHAERRREGRHQEILSHGTPYHDLRRAVDYYEQLVEYTESSVEGLEDFENQEVTRGTQAEIIETSEGVETDEVDLSEDFLSKTI